jgi:predicted metalloenzyme YecM
MTIPSFEVFASQIEDYIQVFDRFAFGNELVGKAGADHICWKCETTAEFETMRAMCEPQSLYLYQSYISGRRIAYFKFAHPFITSLGSIYFLELADQKPDQSQTSGLDHIEIYPHGTSVGTLVSHLESHNVVLQKIVRPHHTTFDLAIDDHHMIRLESEPLIQKIIAKEL